MSSRALLSDQVDEYRRYRALGERALARTPDAALNAVGAVDANSPAMIVRHLSGNLRSRFTDFLTSDGEKPWRARDEEFAERRYTRAEVDEHWRAGWTTLDGALAELTDADLTRTVMIRGEPLSVHAALCRSVAHVAYHVGQLVLLARERSRAPWPSLSIPKGASETYRDSPPPTGR